MGSPRFSIVVLARDEARALPRLLDDLEDFIARRGEVLLLDTGSSDQTVAVARSRGCRVEAVGDRFDSVLKVDEVDAIERRLARAGEGPLVEAGRRLFHFGNARQHAGELAANRFVLQLDASDEVLALDVDALDEHIGAGGAGAFDYEQLYGNVALRIARFYDRTRYRWEGRVHEHLEGIPGSGAAPTLRGDATLLQVRHHKDESKPRHYLAGLALEVLERPQRPRWWHYLGRELLYERWYASAIDVLQRHVATEAAWPTERSQSLCFIGECLEALGRPGEAEESYSRAFALDASRREPLLRLASACSQRGDFAAAARHAGAALAIPRTSSYPEVEANYTWVPHSLLYWSLFWLGRRDEAREHWEAFRSLAPEESWSQEHMRLFPPLGPPPAPPSPADPAASSRPGPRQ